MISFHVLFFIWFKRICYLFLPEKKNIFLFPHKMQKLMVSNGNYNTESLKIHKKHVKSSFFISKNERILN